MKTETSVDTYKKLACRYCDSPLDGPFLELGTMPLANSYLTQSELQRDEFECPLSLTFCPVCKLVQLSHVVPPDLMFANYLYVSSTTKTFQEHFASYANQVKQTLIPKDNLVAVDIGSNDGLLVSCYEREGMKGIGVDPAKNLSDAANQKGITTINRYFDKEAVQEIADRWGKAHVISGNNVFAHIDDVQSVLKNVNELLDAQGLFVIEFPYLSVMLEDMVFDMIYHEHLSYISVNALTFFYNRFGLEIVDIKQVSVHGGTLRVYAQKKGGPYSVQGIVDELKTKEREKGYLEKQAYEEFAKRVNNVKKELRNFVDEIKQKGGSISGYGAPAKASTIINFCEFTKDQIDYLVDDNPLKQNYFSPGAQIPIVPSSHLSEHPTDMVIIFAWNFASEILKKVAPIREKGMQFIIPLPKPKTV